MMYPLKFEVILKSILWGGSEICKFKNLSTKLDGIGESWEISQVKDNVSVIANGEYKGKNLTELMQEKGEKRCLKTTLYPHVKCMAFRRMNWLKRLV